jgi:hypothetical protein
MNHKDIYTRMLCSGFPVQTYFDAGQCTGLPPHLRAGQVRLDLGLNMPVAVHPLDVTDDGITAGVSINRTRHLVHIPWAALMQAVGEDGMPRLTNPALIRRVLTDSIVARTEPEQRKAAATRSPHSNVVAVDFRTRRRA